MACYRLNFTVLPYPIWAFCLTNKIVPIYLKFPDMYFNIGWIPVIKCILNNFGFGWSMWLLPILSNTSGLVLQNRCFKIVLHFVFLPVLLENHFLHFPSLFSIPLGTCFFFLISFYIFHSFFSFPSLSLRCSFQLSFSPPIFLLFSFFFLPMFTTFLILFHISYLLFPIFFFVFGLLIIRCMLKG